MASDRGPARVIGLSVNNYRIVSLLGEGGMGAVYLAEHPVIGRKAAVKILRRELAENQVLVSRFMNEARAASSIHHPNIIDVIDVGLLPDSRIPYMMMEYLPGESLGKRLSRLGRLDVGSAVQITLQTASALAAAHAKHIVHRDLKPDNLFLVTDERVPAGETVRVLDFGIAKLRGELKSNSVDTHIGTVMGTPPYMSPEQCRGLTDEIDHRTDVYALGIILYEMLCGAPPFEGDAFGDVLVMHLIQEPAPPRRKNPDVPASVEQVILRALAKRREDRFASMTELAAALDPSWTQAMPSTGKLGTRPSIEGVGPASLSGTTPRPGTPVDVAPAAAQPGRTGLEGEASVPSAFPSFTTISTSAGEVATEVIRRRRYRLVIAVAAAGTVAAAGIAVMNLRAPSAGTRVLSGRAAAPAPPVVRPPPAERTRAPAVLMPGTPVPPTPAAPASSPLPVAAPPSTTASPAYPAGSPAARPGRAPPRRATAGAPRRSSGASPSPVAAPQAPGESPPAHAGPAAPPAPRPKTRVEKW